MPRTDKIIGGNFNHIYERMFGMGSDANACLNLTKYVNENIFIGGNRFLKFDFALDPVIISPLFF
jgi:hypothetical protein